MMDSKARLFGDDTALSAILATKDPREQKRLGRHVRLFDPKPWCSECEHIVLHGNLAKFSQNEEMRLALIQTGDRRLAEASPHDTLWGIGLSARHSRASSPDSWCSQNLLGQTLENAREFFRRDIPASLSHTGDPGSLRRRRYGLRGRPGHSPSPRNEPPSCQYPIGHALCLHRFGARRPRLRGTLGPRTAY